MGNELELKEMLDFIYSYNVNSNRNNIFLNQTVIAENYLKRLKNNMDSPYYLKYSTPIAFLTLAKTSSDFARAFFDPSSNIL